MRSFKTTVEGEIDLQDHSDTRQNPFHSGGFHDHTLHPVTLKERRMIVPLFTHLLL